MAHSGVIATAKGGALQLEVTVKRAMCRVSVLSLALLGQQRQIHLSTARSPQASGCNK